MQSYYFVPSSAGTVVSTDGSSIKISSTSSNVKLNISSNKNDFAIEFTVLSDTGNIALGIGDYSTKDSRTAYTGKYSTGCSINISDGVLHYNGAVVATVKEFITKKGDVVALKVDSKANLIHYFKNGLWVYTYTIPFSYSSLIFEVGTGSQINGEILINYNWAYDYSTFKYDGTEHFADVLVIKNKDSYYSLSNKGLLFLPNISDNTLGKYGLKKGLEILLDVPYTTKIYITNEYKILGVGKVFEKEIDTSKLTKGITTIV
ncbi:hypothetical protein ACIQXG_10570 [Lysinibacillus sphaericus]|uniref:hypothetical protein n=1 Tax=Lysinibacillus sphaericus TaxID=1421 RepID=UPI00382B4CDF